MRPPMPGSGIVLSNCNTSFSKWDVSGPPPQAISNMKIIQPIDFILGELIELGSRYAFRPEQILPRNIMHRKSSSPPQAAPDHPESCGTIQLISPTDLRFEVRDPTCPYPRREQ